MNSPPKIIIIGAGVAGLAACSYLRERGIDVFILEARNRCGGRIWSENYSGIVLNRGASWIHGHIDNPITKLAMKANIIISKMEDDRLNFYNRYKNLIPAKDVQQFEILFQNILEQTKKLAKANDRDLPLNYFMDKIIRKTTLTENQNDLLRCKQKRFEDYMGAGYKSLSGKHWDDEHIWPGKKIIDLLTRTIMK